MRKWYSTLLVAVFLTVGAAAAWAADDVKQIPSCKYCGMDREKFAYSRIVIEYDDGKAQGFCSIRCAALDLAANMGRAPKTISVGDYNTKELIDAEKAFWVIGGSKMGVMSDRAKWAFKTEADAAAFVKEFGGTQATFEMAMKAAYEDMYQDTKTIRKRRAMMKKEMMEENKVDDKDMMMEHHH
jgi:copper chaperone NosL